MSGYKAVLFAPDGDWVTDHRADTVDEVHERLADQGSRWFFYPFVAVIVDHGAVTTATQRIVDVAEPWEDMKGVTIRTFGRMLADTPTETLAAILG